MRENRPYGSEGGEGVSPSLPLSVGLPVEPTPNADIAKKKGLPLSLYALALFGSGGRI